MPRFSDPTWDEAAQINAGKGFPFAVWGHRKDLNIAITLLGSCPTRERAEMFASAERVGLRPKGVWLVWVKEIPKKSPKTD